MASELDTDLILLQLVQTRPDGPVVWPACHLHKLAQKARMPQTSYAEADLVKLLRRDVPDDTARTSNPPPNRTKAPGTQS